MRLCEQPTARAASTKARSFSESTCAHHPCNAGPAYHADHQAYAEQAALQFDLERPGDDYLAKHFYLDRLNQHFAVHQAGECKGQQQRRQGQHDIGQAHEDRIDPSSVISRIEPDEDADDQGSQHGDGADGQRDAGAVQDAAEDVATQAVGAEGELARRGERHAVGVESVRKLLVGHMGSQQIGEGGDKDQQQDNGQSSGDEAVAQQGVPGGRSGGEVGDDFGGTHTGFSGWDGRGVAPGGGVPLPARM